MKILIAVTGASGSCYAQRLLARIQETQNSEDIIHLIFSDTAKKVWEYELENTSYNDYTFYSYHPDDFFGAPASGSSHYDTMIICPCSMGTLARIAHGISNNLISRAADVMLKEHKKLVLVTREAPLNLIHINNMKTLVEAGGIILPASPSFYSKPQNLEACIDTVIDKIFSAINYPYNGFEWGNQDPH